MHASFYKGIWQSYAAFEKFLPKHIAYFGKRHSFKAAKIQHYE